MGQTSETKVTTPSGLTVFQDTEAGSSPDAVSTGSATVFYLVADNSANSEPCYVQIFNAAVGDVTVGTTPADEIIYIPGSSSQLPESAAVTVVYLTLNGANGVGPGKSFSTAVTAACTTASNGTTGPAKPVSVTIAYVGSGGGGGDF